MGHLIGGSIGEVLEVDTEENDMAWGEFMRVQVLVNVSKPLLKGNKIEVGSEASGWIHFSYECLPNFY